MSNIDNIKDLTILIVDDNSQNIQLVHTILQKAGYLKIAFATSGVKALELTSTLKPDLILLDIMMPEMDGYEVLKKLKANELTQDISIIFLTAKADNEDVLEGFHLGVVDYITKPFDNEILLARVQTHLLLRYQTRLIEKEKLVLEQRVQEEVFKRLDSNMKLYALYEQTNLGMSFFDKNGKFIDINSRFHNLLGYEKEEILNLDIYLLTHLDDIKETTQALQEISEHDLNYLEFEKRCIKKDGSFIWLNTLLTKISDPYNENNFYIASTCKDITQEVLVREELKAKDEMLVNQSRQAAMGNMLGIISHQWRQPLGIIGIMANNIQLDIALEVPIETDSLNTTMDKMYEQVKYLSDTIGDFKNYFKPNKEKNPTFVNDVMDRTLDLIGQSLTSQNIKIDTKYNAKTEIDIYPNELMQVFINIINNAKDAMITHNVQNPHISIEIFEDEKNIITTIADNGGGIPEDVLDKIGELYFSTKESNGTGLGIYMSKDIVQKHLKGTLTWENRDDGACFYIKISKSN